MTHLHLESLTVYFHSYLQSGPLNYYGRLPNSTPDIVNIELSLASHDTLVHTLRVSTVDDTGPVLHGSRRCMVAEELLLGGVCGNRFRALRGQDQRKRGKGINGGA